MSPKKRNQRLLGYTRVSRMREEGISPELQRKAIEAYVQAHSHEVEWLEPDLDESGRSLDRPAMQEALRLLREGKADGIIAARLDRLTRKVSDLGKLLELAQEQDWNLVAIDLGVDLTTSNGKMVANFLGTVAEWELDRRRESWSEARSHAVANGVHVTPTLPAGYDRDPNSRRLVPNEHASAITAAFEARAKGASWTKVAQLLTDAGVPTSHQTRGTQETGLPWTAKSAVKLLQNRVYLGEARSGSFTNKDAHQPLVSPGLWARVQARRQKGDYADPNRERALLANLCHCATCGGALTMDSTRRNGKVYPFYRCKGQSRCASRATIGATRLEGYVIEQVLTNAVFPPVQPRTGGSPEYEAAVARVDEATAKLDEWTAIWTAAGVSPETAAQMAAGLERERAEALAALNALPVQTDESIMADWPDEAKAAYAKVTEGPFKASPELIEVFDAAPKALKRKMLERTLESVIVKPGRSPVEERVGVTLRKDFKP